MFDKFGEFDSADEINMAAEGLFNEGDMESLKILAEENGLGELVSGYVEGCLVGLCDVTSAAIGKLEIEASEMKLDELMADWVEYIKSLCFDSAMVAIKVRQKDKSLKKCIANILKWSFEHQKDIDKEILTAAGVKASKVTFGIPGMRTAKKLIKQYYIG